MTNILASRFVGVSSLLAPEMRARFEGALAAVNAHVDRDKLMVSHHAAADDGFWPAPDDWRSAYRPYVVRDGILFVPVKGLLLHDFPWALGSWATGYIYIARAIERGLADVNVRGIALAVDSYGGEVAGCFELVDRIFAARGQKPIRSFAHEFAYSAGYAIACAADQIVMSRTGGVGSIGVVCAHVDVSKAMDDAGVKVTFIFAGKHKVDGNAYEPLPEDVKKRWQAEIDETYGIFVATVSRNRGLDESFVRSTEALTYTARQAVESGLADSIGPLDDAVAAFAADLSSPQHDGDDGMSKDKSAADAAATENTQAIATARAEGKAEGKTEGVAEGRKAERDRVKAILGSEEAKGRTAQAHHIAFNTEMSAEDAKSMLASSAKEAPAEPANPLAAAMKDVRNPQIGADAASGESVDEAAQIAGNIIALHRGKQAG